MKKTFSAFNIVYFLIFSLLLASPLSYGGVTPGGRLVIQLTSFFALVVYLISSRREASENPLPGIERYELGALSVFFAVCLIQIIPLPTAALRLFSPGSYEVWTSSQTLLESIGLGRTKWLNTISVDPHSTWIQTVTLLSYISFGFVISRMFRTESGLRLLLIPVIILSFFEASYGIYQYLTDIGESYMPNKSVATGTYVNRNNFAGLLEMTIPLILGYTFSIVTWKPNLPFFSNFSSSDNFSKQILYLFLLGIMVLALIFSLSRMGILVIFLSLLFFVLVYSNMSRQAGRNSIVLIIFVFAIVLLYALAIGVYPAFERFIAISEEAPSRVLVWRDMLRVIPDFPLFGTGLDTFKYIYLYYNSVITEAVEFRYAHNDYLQIIIETGIVGAAAILSAFAVFLRKTFRKLRTLHDDNDYFRFFLGLGALTGVVAIMMHSLVDFNLHIPANATYFALLIGILSAVTHSERGKEKKRRRISEKIPEADLTIRNRRKELSASGEDRDDG